MDSFASRLVAGAKVSAAADVNLPLNPLLTLKPWNRGAQLAILLLNKRLSVRTGEIY